MKFITNNKLVAAISLSVFLVACGGGGGGSTTAVTASGQFKDNNTQGVSYVSGGQTGTTDADGTFTYEVGQSVTFSIGGVTLGSTTGKAVVTPLDLFSGKSTNSVEVKNLVRFLMMLDEDGDTSNGIKITPQVQNAAQAWSPVDFTTTDLPTALASIISDAQTADGGTHSLPSATVAKNHIDSTVRCSYAGAFKGTFTGDDQGPFGGIIDATTGLVVGFAYSDLTQTLYTLNGTTALSLDNTASFISGYASGAASYVGSMDTIDKMSGGWSASFSSATGAFSGERISGNKSAKYRYTGQYSGDDYGLMTFDIDSSNSVTGMAYSVPNNILYTLTGSLSGTSLSATVSDGTVISGTLNTTAGTVSGSWSDTGNATSGTYTGNGCQLN